MCEWVEFLYSLLKKSLPIVNNLTPRYTKARKLNTGIFMDWTQFAIFLIANMVFSLTLWLWSRAEARTDNRRALDLIEAIKDEMKDFHGRLCAIEERNKK